MDVLPISEIVVGEGRRPLRDVRALADSIRELGLLNPITITTDRKLRAGRHRLEACKLLGWEQIPVNIVDLSDLRAELAEIDENLIRNDLTVLERSEQVARRKKVYEQLHPETRHVTERGGPGRGHKTGEIISPVLAPPTFTEDTAAKTGTSVRTVQQEVQIAEKLPEDVKEQIRETPLADNKTDLLDLARLPVEEQRQVVERIAAQPGKKKASVKGIVRDIANTKRREAREAQAQAEPVKPSITLARWENWLPGQPQCELLLTDPIYKTDVPDIAAFADGWLPAALAKVKPAGRAYVFIGAYPDELAAYLRVGFAAAADLGFTLANVLVWEYRNTIGPAPKLDYKLNWQAVLYFRGPEAPPLDCPELTEQFSVHPVNAPDGRLGERYHAWQKPDELAERLVRHATKPGDLVLDPFAGTGTFILAANKLGRVGRGCDNNEERHATAIQRGCRAEGLAPVA